jgi:hypothetical protein
MARFSEASSSNYCWAWRWHKCGSRFDSETLRESVKPGIVSISGLGDYFGTVFTTAQIGFFAKG